MRNNNTVPIKVTLYKLYPKDATNSDPLHTYQVGYEEQYYDFGETGAKTYDKNPLVYPTDIEAFTELFHINATTHTFQPGTQRTYYLN